MENKEVLSIDEMAEMVLDDKIFEDEWEELRYTHGYVRGATDMLKRIVEHLNDDYNDLDDNQIGFRDKIIGYLKEITYNGKPILE